MNSARYIAVMDPLSAFALQVVLAAAFLSGLYWVIRKAVTAGRLDAQREREQVNATPPSPAQTTRG